MGIYTNKLYLIYNEDFPMMKNQFENISIIESTNIIDSIVKYWEKFKTWFKDKVKNIYSNYFKKLPNKPLKLLGLTKSVDIKYISNYSVEELNKIESKINTMINLAISDKNGDYNLHLDEELNSELDNTVNPVIQTYRIDKNNISYGESIIDKNLELQSTCQNFINNINKIYLVNIDKVIDSIKSNDRNSKVVASFKINGEIRKNNDNIVSIDNYIQLSKLVEILRKYSAHLLKISIEISNCNLYNNECIKELKNDK